MGLSFQHFITFPDRPTPTQQPGSGCLLPSKELVQRLGLVWRQLIQGKHRLVWIQPKRLGDLTDGQRLLMEKPAVGNWRLACKIGQVVDVEVALGLPLEQFHRGQIDTRPRIKAVP